jgi:hypothetical protein
MSGIRTLRCRAEPCPGRIADRLPDGVRRIDKGRGDDNPLGRCQSRHSITEYGPLKILRATATAAMMLAVSYAHASAQNADGAPVRPSAVNTTVARNRVVLPRPVPRPELAAPVQAPGVPQESSTARKDA